MLFPQNFIDIVQACTLYRNYNASSNKSAIYKKGIRAIKKYIQIFHFVIKWDYESVQDLMHME